MIGILTKRGNWTQIPISTERKRCANTQEEDACDWNAASTSQGTPTTDGKHQKLGRGKEDFPSMFQREHGRADTLILDS